MATKYTNLLRKSPNSNTFDKMSLAAQPNVLCLYVVEGLYLFISNWVRTGV